VTAQFQDGWRIKCARFGFTDSVVTAHVIVGLGNGVSKTSAFPNASLGTRGIVTASEGWGRSVYFNQHKLPDSKPDLGPIPQIVVSIVGPGSESVLPQLVAHDRRRTRVTWVIEAEAHYVAPSLKELVFDNCISIFAAVVITGKEAWFTVYYFEEQEEGVG